MPRLIARAVLATVAALVLPTAGTACEKAPPATDARPVVSVRVLVRLDDGRATTGWGLNLGGSELLVPRHLLHGAESAEVVVSGERLAVRGVVWESPLDDLSAVVVNGDLGEPATLSHAAVDVGDQLWLGFASAKGVLSRSVPCQVVLAGTLFGDTLHLGLGGLHAAPGDSGRIVMDEDDLPIAMLVQAGSNYTLGIDIREVFLTRRDGPVVPLDELVLDDPSTAIAQIAERDASEVWADAALLAADRLPTMPEWSLAVLLAGVHCAARGRCDDARTLLLKVVDRWPNSRIALDQTCLALYWCEDWASIATLPLPATGDDFALWRAIAEFERGNHENALRECRAAIRSNRNSAHSRLWEGKALLGLGLEAEAVRSLEWSRDEAREFQDEWCETQATKILDSIEGR